LIEKILKKVLLFIGSFTLTIELIGAFLIYFIIKPYYSTGNALFHSIFQSISSFCNAGMSSFDGNISVFYNHPAMLCVVALLVFCGGFGFTIWYELFLFMKSAYYTRGGKRKRFKLSLTSKMIITSTTLVIATSVILFTLLEHHQFSTHWSTTALNMVFNSIAYRSAGISTVDIHTLSAASILLIMVLSFIGSSPGSTGSGVKITTFYVFTATVQSALSNHTDVDIKKRQIPKDQVLKALAVVAISLGWILVSTFILLVYNHKANFLTLLFESVSSFTNLGLSTGLTPHLTMFEKIIICFNMFFGRISSYTLVLALRARKARKARVKLQYPEERPMIS
jgi:trk system potassium uptake protein TrkH